MEKFYKQREKDLEDELQMDISEIARESGLLITMFVTSKVWNDLIKPDEEAIKRGENENSRTKEILSELVTVIRVSRQTQKTNLLNFSADLTVDGKSRNFDLISYLGPVSDEINKPSITLLTPEEIV